jgi:hypothetical protein
MTIQHEILLNLMNGNTGLPNAEIEVMEEIKKLSSQSLGNVVVTEERIPKYYLKYDKNKGKFELLPIFKTK